MIREQLLKETLECLYALRETSLATPDARNVEDLIKKIELEVLSTGNEIIWNAALRGALRKFPDFLEIIKEIVDSLTG